MEKIVTLRFLRVGLELALSLGQAVVSTEGGVVVVIAPAMGMWDLHTWVLLESTGRDFTGWEIWDSRGGRFSGCNFVVRARIPSLDLLDLGRVGTPA